MRLNNLAFVAVATMTIVGCGCGGNQQQSTDMTTPTQPGGAGRDNAAPKVGKHILVGLVFDSGGRGDKSFNDSAFAGTELAKKDVNIDVKTVDTKLAKDFEQNLTAMADAGCDLIIGVGNDQKDALATVAAKYPDKEFAIVDATVDAKNVRSLVFAEEQGSFLAGFVAASTTKTGKIGFVGGMPIPLIKKFETGYDAGALTANPKVEILPAKYTASWDDVDKGKAAADVLFNGGADIVYQAAGKSGLGVINSAKEHKLFAIGVDSNQDDVAKGTVLTSMIKHVDQAVYQTIKDAATDKFTAGTKVYDLKTNGVGLSEMKNTKSIVGKDTMAKLLKVEDSIKKGAVVVPSTPEQLTAYTQKLTATTGTAPSTAKK